MICFIWPELLKHSFIHTSVQSVSILRPFFNTRHFIWWRERLKWKLSCSLYCLCPVQVLAQLNYCRSKHEKNINSWTDAPPHKKTSHVNRQSKGSKRASKLFFILAVGKNRFDLKCLESSFKHSLCIININIYLLNVSHMSSMSIFGNPGKCTETHFTKVSDISIFMTSGTCCSPEEQRTVLKVKWAEWVCGVGGRRSTTVRTVTWHPTTAVT